MPQNELNTNGNQIKHDTDSSISFQDMLKQNIRSVDEVSHENAEREKRMSMIEAECILGEIKKSYFKMFNLQNMNLGTV